LGGIGMTDKIDSCMVLAAGLGRRMRPLTDSLPKPLIPVAGKTLLDHALDMAAGANISRAIVNVHYFPEAVEAHVAQRTGTPEITISDERGILLETGGGVLKALPLIARNTVAVFNADNVWVDGATGTADEVLTAWRPDIMDVLLLLTPTDTAIGYDGPGDFNLSADAQLIRRGSDARADYVYAGIHVLKTQLFNGMEIAPFSLNRVWDIAATHGRLFGVVHSGRWYHVGTPEGVMLANNALSSNAPFNRD
jgi:N-acetyl-alpha-D-muramate 1-phosphate uridylyltransferase